MATAERWRTCSRNEAYEVSDRGRVRRKDTRFVLTAAKNNSRAGKRPGYFKVHLGRGCQAYVHHLVAEAFIGPRPTGYDIDHVDWDRSNNAATNLRYLPVRENRMRWVGPGPRDFALAKEVDRQKPDDHEPLTVEEEQMIQRELAEAGWR